jgi:ankyrin repeat protein
LRVIGATHKEAHVANLPASPDLSHLRKQAKRLLRQARAGNAPALQRFIEALSAVRGTSLAALADRALRLHDAQSVIAREYGFRSWTELKRYVDWRRADRAERVKAWLRMVYEGNARERGLAVRMLNEERELLSADAWLGCAVGDEAAIRAALADDPGWANLKGGPLGMPPLVAVTHSLLLLEDGFEPRLLACARLLLEHGADANGSWTDPRWPDWPLSVLFGAAGRSHHAGMTMLLLEAGANPDDNESLYHSVESRDSACTRLLLEAGAKVAGTNAIARVIDYGKLDDLRLMLQRGGRAEERSWIHHAIRRGRSLEYIWILKDAGADLRASNRDGLSLCRWAQMFGRVDVLDLLREAGIEEALTDEEQFVAACTRGDEPAARIILERESDIISRLSPKQLQALPELADISDVCAVQTNLDLGLPREVKAAWDTTALHLAVYRGDARMAELLLKSGASWRTKNGFGGNVVGTLSYASQSDPEDPVAPRDYAGCARVMVAHGVPPSEPPRYVFSAEVTDVFDTLAHEAAAER